MALNLEKQLLFYGSYHHNPVNIGIHIIFVPMIMLTTFMLLTNTPSLPMPNWLSIPHLPADVGTVGTLLYSTLYILLEPVAGGFLAPLLLAWTAYAHILVATYGSTANWIAGALNLASWMAQFIGHGVYEGRAPALVDNLVQALFLAPFFVWMEVLFMFGYRPELKARLDRAVEGELKRLEGEKAAKKAGNRADGNGAAK